ncbi:hypothetical protein [Xingshan nematode virus 2]|uniref:hypothetical protein n=1 Tax=Xingshan nematode virus 2 TaxID=1923761 RepID=UPI00090A0C0E|nr:hypothetical protein [Xingshan nematode virus 2]APG77850.1 hypothetical protein [Xingshan nematode virus 2]
MASSALMLPSENGRPPKFYDHATGIQTVRGGQQVGEGFFSSVFNSFYNIIYHFWGLTFAVLGIFTLLSEYGTASGPLEVLLQAILKFISDPDVPIVLKSIASAFAWLLGYMVKYKYVVAYSAILFVPAIVKPSTRNIMFSFLLIFMAFLHYITILQVLLLSLLFYLFVMLRTPAHKFFVLFMALIVFSVGFTEHQSFLSSKLNLLLPADLSKPLTFKPNTFLLPDAQSPSARAKRDENEILRHQVAQLMEKISNMHQEMETMRQAASKPNEATTAAPTVLPRTERHKSS